MRYKRGKEKKRDNKSKKEREIHNAIKSTLELKQEAVYGEDDVIEAWVV